MTFQEHLSSIRQSIETSLEPRQVKIMHRATEELIQSGQEERILAVGDKMPQILLSNQEDLQVKFSSLLQEGPLVITFYRGVWCPYCNADLQNLNSYTQAVEDAGARMVAISPETGDFVKQIHRKFRLNFDLFSDPGNRTADAFGLRFRLNDELIALYRDELEIDLTRHNGDDSWTLPMPARYVIDRSGIVVYAEAGADYTLRPDPDAMISVLESLISQD